MEHSAAMRTDGLQLHTSAQVNLTNMILNQRSKTYNTTRYIILVIKNSKWEEQIIHEARGVTGTRGTFWKPLNLGDNYTGVFAL